jgi:DNA gyrase subunit A
VFAARLLARPSDTLRVKNTNGTVLSFGQMKYTVTGRGGKGVKTSQRSEFSEVVADPIQLVDWSTLE